MEPSGQCTVVHPQLHQSENHVKGDAEANLAQTAEGQPAAVSLQVLCIVAHPGPQT